MHIKRLLLIALTMITSLAFAKSDKVEVVRVGSVQMSAGRLNYPEKRTLIQATKSVFDRAGFEMINESGFLDASSSKRTLEQTYTVKNRPADMLRAELKLNNTGLDVYFYSDKSFPFKKLEALAAEIEKRAQSRMPSATIRTRLTPAWDGGTMPAAKPATHSAAEEKPWYEEQAVKAAPAAMPAPTSKPAPTTSQADLKALEAQIELYEKAVAAEAPAAAKAKAAPRSQAAEIDAMWGELGNSAPAPKAAAGSDAGEIDAMWDEIGNSAPTSEAAVSEVEAMWNEVEQSKEPTREAVDVEELDWEF